MAFSNSFPAFFPSKYVCIFIVLYFLEEFTLYGLRQIINPALDLVSTDLIKKLRVNAAVDLCLSPNSLYGIELTMEPRDEHDNVASSTQIMFHDSLLIQGDGVYPLYKCVCPLYKCVLRLPPL